MIGAVFLVTLLLGSVLHVAFGLPGIDFGGYCDRLYIRNPDGTVAPYVRCRIAGTSDLRSAGLDTATVYLRTTAPAAERIHAAAGYYPIEVAWFDGSRYASQGGDFEVTVERVARRADVDVAIVIRDPATARAPLTAPIDRLWPTLRNRKEMAA